MSKPLAWFIYLFSGLFFLAFILWPIAPNLRGACIDADVDGHGRIVPGFGDADLRFRGIEGLASLG